MVPGYNAFSISTLVDFNINLSYSMVGYNAFSISTLVDRLYRESTLFRL